MTKRSLFRHFKTSPEIIRLAVMMYVRFPLSLRNIEDLLHKPGIDICHETVRFGWHRFGQRFASEIRRGRVGRMRSSHWRWPLDEMFVEINGWGGLPPGAASPTAPCSSRRAPPPSPSGAPAAPDKGQRSCPWRDWFAFVCQHRHVQVPSRLFRRLFLDGLLDLHRSGHLAFFDDQIGLVWGSAFSA